MSILRATNFLPDFKNTFETQNIVVIPQIFNDIVLNVLTKYLNESFAHGKVMDERCEEYGLDDHATKLKLHHIFNTPDFLHTMKTSLGLSASHCMTRMYYNDKNCQNLTWHDDSYKVGRFAALRVELSRSPYSGGEFFFSDRKLEREIKMSPMNFGDAVLFRVERNRFFHMVGPVLEGTRKSLIIFF